VEKKQVADLAIQDH
jgi:hypothetical protein